MVASRHVSLERHDVNSGVSCCVVTQCYALELRAKMADEEAEQDRGPESRINIQTEELRQRLQQLQQVLVEQHSESPGQSSAEYCQEFCTVSSSPSHWTSSQLASTVMGGCGLPGRTTARYH